MGRIKQAFPQLCTENTPTVIGKYCWTQSQLIFSPEMSAYPQVWGITKVDGNEIKQGGGVAGEGSQLQKPIEVTIHAILESQDILFLGTNYVVLKGDCNYFETSFI